MQNLPLHTGTCADQSPVIRQVVVSLDDNENPGRHAKEAVVLTDMLCDTPPSYDTIRLSLTVIHGQNISENIKDTTCVSCSF